MNNITITTNNSIALSQKNYIIYDKTIDIDMLKSIICPDTSIIIFDNNFSADNRIFEIFNQKLFDKLIVLGYPKNLKPQKRLFIASKINKRILSHVKKNILLIIKLNDNYNINKAIINNLILLYKLCPLMKLNLNISIDDKKILSYIINDSSSYLPDILNAFSALLYNDRQEKYEYIYDVVCNYLDDEFRIKNPCDFKNNQCCANRLKNSWHSSMGCCYSFKYAGFFSLSLVKDVKLCQYLDCKTCSTKCISCKLFTCKYLKKHGFSFDTKKILLLDCFFNNKQHLILRHNFFKTREDIINKLLEKDNSPYFVYYLCSKYEIK